MDVPSIMELDPDHPGFRDPDYRKRRDLIANIALNHRMGDPIPDAPYTSEEHGVWRAIWDSLADLHKTHVVQPVQEILGRIELDHQEIPQLSVVNEQLKEATGYTMEPVAGLVTAADFLQALGEGYFCSTQYIRHASKPLYTPEPDVVHELVGHAALLSDPRIAQLQLKMGKAVDGASADEVDRLIRLYWYTIEFGVAWEDGQIKAYGAGLLSSCGELAQIAEGPELRPWNVVEMVSTPYDPTDYQGTLWVSASYAQAMDDIEAFLDQGMYKDEHFQS